MPGYRIPSHELYVYFMGYLRGCFSKELLSRIAQLSLIAFYRHHFQFISNSHYLVSLTIYHVDRLFSRTSCDASSRSDSQLRAPRLNCIPSYCNLFAFHLHSYIHRSPTIVYPICCCAVAGFGWLWVPYIYHKYLMTNLGEYSIRYHWTSKAPQEYLTVGPHWFLSNSLYPGYSAVWK